MHYLWKKRNQGQNLQNKRPTTSNRIRIALIIRIQCTEKRDIGTGSDCHAQLSKGGALGMDHDQRKMRMGTECAGCNIMMNEETSEL